MGVIRGLWCLCVSLCRDTHLQFTQVLIFFPLLLIKCFKTPFFICNVDALYELIILFDKELVVWTVNNFRVSILLSKPPLFYIYGIMRGLRLLFPMIVPHLFLIYSSSTSQFNVSFLYLF